MSKKVFTRKADLAKYRISMKRKLRLLGISVNNDETTERLEEMVKSISK